jgi:hypothetical protein
MHTDVWHEYASGRLERSRMRFRLGIAAALLMLGGAVFAASASAKGRDVFKVCKHGCAYSSIQKAVDQVKKGKDSMVKIKPGTYHEGVQVYGHKYDSLIITGTADNPRKVVLDGRNAHIQGKRAEVAQNGIDGRNVDGLKVKRLWARNYPSNGVYIHADPGDHCHGFAMDHDLASFNRSYGLFAKHCTGGKITNSTGWGHGDSAFYIGETPPQKNPKWTDISNDKAYENVLGYSGTNSKYVDIHDSMFYNNGAGIVPNTLASEKFQPNADGKIRNNDIFWNNFNYFLPKSPVTTVSSGLGEFQGRTINYPTGIGVVLFGSDGWVVKKNNIFGNFYWGAAAFSDATDSSTKALNMNNRFIANAMGRGGKDTNRFDFFNDGSMQGNCFEGNNSSTFDVTQNAKHPKSFIYPACPAPANAGTGSYLGDSGQVAELASYVLSTPPCSQEDKWARHTHPKFKGITPIDTKDFGPCKPSK